MLRSFVHKPVSVEQATETMSGQMAPPRVSMTDYLSLDILQFPSVGPAGLYVTAVMGWVPRGGESNDP